MKKKEAKISILIPCYNKTDFYPRLFKSLINQKDKNFKIVFVNDASTDNTQAILEDFKQKYSNLFDIKIYQLEQNSGLAFVRNFLISKTETEYFYFLDSDDIITKNAMKHYNKALEKKPNCEIYYSNHSLTYNNIRIPNIQRNYFMRFIKTKKQKMEYLKYGSAYIWNKAIKTEWFKQFGMSFLNGYLFEDFPICFSIFLSAKNTHFINKITYKYFLNSQGLSSGNSPKRILGIAKNLDYLYSKLEEINTQNMFSNRIESIFFKNLIYYIFKRKSFKVVTKNTELYREVFEEFFEVAKKYNFEHKYKKYQNKFSFVFKSSLKRLKKLEGIYWNEQK
ncbi:glycosyltransferase family 2 protein [Mycoplasma procyoni]|uniref:glycosyltransferase family 2 protein n=1 Tax=Mycoplasma procyoni TaxID=568784 RepID=UPI00197BEB23|nr:glycosyltransferase family 2 protein [Mycoplasma procyoni]MBN3534960.1 glycosyltransferase family 2 protein [Mycoplasma procyoni]